VSNQLRYFPWRIPAIWNSSEIACYANAIPSGANPANIFSPSGPTTAGATGCLPDAFTGQLAIPITATPTVLTTSSGGNLIDENFIYYYGQRTISNTTLLEVEANRHISAHIGFRYGDRRFNDKDNSYSTTIYYPYNLWTGSTLVAQAGGTVTTEPVGDAGEVLIHEKTLLAGVILRPIDAWRVNADFEFVNNDQAFTRIAPTRLFVFRGRSSYRVNNGLNVSGSVNLRQGSNDVSPAGFISAPEQTHRDHAYSYNGNVNYTLNDRLAFDLGYTFNDIYSNTGSCLPVSTRPSVIPAEGGALSYCYDPTAAVPTPATGDYAVIVRYKERINTAYFTVMYKPVKRVALSIGYDISSNSGSDGFLRADTLAPLLLQQSRVQAGGSTTAFVPYNPNVPQGPLAINFHKPSAGASIEVAKGVFLKGDYAYYGYNEKSDPTGASALVGGAWVGVVPRDFHATVGTVGVKYQF
jgi:opacity protein-like surface antigen